MTESERRKNGTQGFDLDRWITDLDRIIPRGKRYLAAEILGFNATTLSRQITERRYPEVGTFLTICSAYGLNPWDYFRPTRGEQT